VKIAIVNNGLAGGGIERASVSLANHWAEEGYSISLVAIYQSKHFFSTHADVHFTEPPFPYGGNKVIYTLRMMRHLRGQILRIKPDVIIAFGENSNPYVLLALLGIGVPIFVSDRMHPKARLPKHTFWLKKQLYPGATGIIAQTNLAKEVIQSYLPPSNIHVISNPVNVIERMDVERKPIIVSVGRLEEVKGHEYLIRAFAKVDQPNWKLSIVGDGSLMESFKNLAKELGIYERVLFHGHLKNFQRELSEASIFVLPSLKEGFPNALLEAMSVPLPCIVTDFMGTNNEIINSGVNGLIVPTKSVDPMAKAINYLIDNPNERESISLNALQVRNDYQFKKIANDWISFICSSIDPNINKLS